MSVRKRKDSDSWQAGWSNLEGKWRTKDFPTKAEAARFEARMKAEVQKGDYTNPHAAKTLLKDVYAKWKECNQQLKPKSIADAESLWRCFVEPKFGNRQIGSITRSDVKAWIADGTSVTGKKASASRMRKATFLLYGILNEAVEQDLLGKVSLGKTKGLIPKLEEKKKHQVISNEELQRLAEASGDYGLLILVAGTVGLRWAELVALTPEDFDFKEKTISISKSLSEVNGSFELVTTKSGKPREVPIPESLQKELKLKVVSTPAGKNVFASSKGDFLRSSNFARRVFKPALKKAGLPDMRFHDLRHSAVTNLLASGTSFISVSKMAGHANPSTTINIYGHETNSHQELLREAIDESFAQTELDRFSTEKNSKSA
ncbi:MAG: tyrosine-type recombinase/integrase [Actinomycetes bacterium]|jgi:integrase